jgi:serine protease Do
VILGIDGERIDGPRTSRAGWRPSARGKTDLIYWHDGSEKTASVKLGSLPDDKEARESRHEQDNNAFSGLGLTLAPASSVEGAGSHGVVVSDIDPDGVAPRRACRSATSFLRRAAVRSTSRRTSARC